MKNTIILIKFLIKSIFCLKFVSSYCGLPAIPYNAQINQIKHKYHEGDSVSYYCELENLKLVGPSIRSCQNGRWSGVVPRCLEEFDIISAISGIEIFDTGPNHTVSLERKAISFGGFNPSQCLESSEMARPHSWRLDLAKAELHISYIEIEVRNKNNKINSTEASNIINLVKVNELRKCKPQLIEYSNELFRLNVTCSLQFNGDTEQNDWNDDQSQMILFEFGTNEITMCDIKIYKRSHGTHHWCGSADVIPHSKRKFIRKNSKYAGNSHYRYICDQGFKLEGNEDVRCGVDNDWLDEFPDCTPMIDCPIEPLFNGTLRHFVDLYYFEGIFTPVVGSVVYYSCEKVAGQLSIMLGDSIRVCGPDGDWSGVAPICILHLELEDYLEHYQEINQNERPFESFEPINNILNVDMREELACGIPAIPLFGKPITQPSLKHLNRHADLRSSYPNGTVISYQCESGYALVSGDMGQRVCFDGKWVGDVGKCAISLGNSLKLNSITLSHWDDHGELVIDNINEINNTNLEILNENFVFRFDPSIEGQCYNFTFDKKQRWTVRLEKNAGISYFQVMLYPGGFFDGKRHVIEPKILQISPLSAKLNEKSCVLTSAWDYNQSKIGTYFHFTCDLDGQETDGLGDYSEIILDLNPERLKDKSYLRRHVSLCSLDVFTSKNKCGTPDIPLHGSVEKNTLVEMWTFFCEIGYQLIGPSIVKCGLNGRWMSDFPTCIKKEACSINKHTGQLQIEYKNLITMNDEDFAGINSVANYSCAQTSNTKALLIGSNLRVCHMMNDFQWSGSDPFCLDPKVLSENKVENHVKLKVLPIILIALTFVIFVVVVLFIARKKQKARHNAIRNIESPYSL